MLNEANDAIGSNDYETAVIRLESALLEGRSLDIGMLAKLPQSYIDRSPLLLKAYGERLTDAGSLQEARAALQKAVKGFARQTFQRELLASFAALAVVHMRTGELHEAETALLFLKSEYARGETETGGHVPFALARGARLIGEERNRSAYYEVAFERFERSGDRENGCRVLLDMLLDLGPRLGRRSDDIQSMLKVRSAADPAYSLYEEAFGAIRLFQDEKWGEAAAALRGLDTDRLPYDLNAAVRCCGHIARLRGGPPLTREEDEALRQLVMRCDSDAGLQLLYARVDFERRLKERDEAGAQRALELARSYEGLCLSGLQASALDDMDREILSLRRLPSDRTEPERAWNVSCFGGIRFSRGSTEMTGLRWKRRKAQELFLYLLLQPQYSSSRDQIADTLFADVELEKQANQLYVTVHQMKQVLRDALGIDRPVVVKDGFVQLSAAFIEHVDAEKYRTLVRVGDQLWTFERELSQELYAQAVDLYGELAPELQYVDWLDRIRGHYAEMQAGALKRLVSFALEKGEFEQAEAYCGEWLRISPAEEEAYQDMIRLLMRQGKNAEAHRRYRTLEKVCREELNTQPLPETKRLLRGEGE